MCNVFCYTISSSTLLRLFGDVNLWADLGGQGGPYTGGISNGRPSPKNLGFHGPAKSFPRLDITELFARYVHGDE